MKKQDVIKQLSSIKDPFLKKSLLELNYIKNVDLSDTQIEVSLSVSGKTTSIIKQLEVIILTKLKTAFKHHKISVKIECLPTVTGIDPKFEGLKNVKNIIAVSSCKGGVGKSTIASNIATTLKENGANVGIFDADVYGPSIPTMFNEESPVVTQSNNLINPVNADGIKLMSFGFIQDEDSAAGAAILRGPMVTQIINQLLTSTQWGDLDYLILDLPPGTGDIQITLCQLIPITAAIIITTPQYISFIDVIKGIEMFDRLKVPTISVIENMSYYTCNNCNEKHLIFGKGVLTKLKKEFGFKHAFSLPLLTEVSEHADNGTPYMTKKENSLYSSTLKNITKSIEKEVAFLNFYGLMLPKVSFDKSKGIYIEDTFKNKGFIQAKQLRALCKCAHCQDEFTGKTLIKNDSISDDVYPLSMNPIGSYALGINWSDSHSSLYPYENLFKLAK